MVAFSSTLARPRYRTRASRGTVPFPAATLKMASLGTTSISANVSLQRNLARRVPSIAFSNIAAPPRLQGANVPSSIDFGKPPEPLQIASQKALTDIGTGIGRKINESVFNQNAKLGAGAIGGFNTSPAASSGVSSAITTQPAPGSSLRAIFT